MNDDNPFKALDKKKFPKDEKAREKQKRKEQEAKRKAEKAAQQARQAESAPADEEAVFFKAMGGVTPLKGEAGREVALAPSAPKPPAKESSLNDEDSVVRSKLQDLVTGKVEFSMQHSDEFISAHVKGLDVKTTNRLKAGWYSPEGHLDMHGQNALQAYSSVLGFIREAYMQGKRCVLVIPGRGKNSPEGYGILRENVQTWLTRDPMKRVVLAFCTALNKHGGAGALYVLLRKKKGKGKINWDRNPADIDLLL